MYLLFEINEIHIQECSLYVRKVICLRQLNKDVFVILFSFFKFHFIDHSRKMLKLPYVVEGRAHIWNFNAEDKLD